MEDNNESVSRNGHAIKHGAIVGIVIAMLTFVIYAIDVALLADWKVGIFFLVAILVAVVIFGIKFRNQDTGYISFGGAFIYSFIFLAVAGLVGSISNILLYEVIDPDLRKTLTEVSIENTISMMEGFGAPSASIDEQVAELQETLPGNFTALGVMKQYGWGLLIYAIISLITGLIIKKNEPIEDI